MIPTAIIIIVITACVMFFLMCLQAIIILDKQEPEDGPSDTPEYTHWPAPAAKDNKPLPELVQDDEGPKPVKYRNRKRPAKPKKIRQRHQL